MKNYRISAALIFAIVLLLINVSPALAAPVITINNPTTTPAQSKTITAITSEGTLSMSNTTGAICDGTLTFVDYSSQTFTSESDNGIKVCYKAENGVAEISYSLSDPIAGIDTTPPVITINNPTTTPAQSKTITANLSDGTLSMSNTTDAICDGTLTFVDYSSQTFTSESDNGKKVCYKAVDIANNTAYNLSNAIAGIDTTAPNAAITYSLAGPYKSGASLTITATFNEDMAVSPVPQISITGANTLAPTGMTRSSSTVYTYLFTVGAGNGTATVALSTGTDLAGNIVTSAPTSGATFAVDNTLPAFTSVAPAASAFINSITTASDVSYTLSEDIASGSIVMTRTGGSTDGTVHTCTLTDAARAGGAHNNLDLSAGVGCTSTQTLVNGAIYTFVFSGTDAAGNSASPVSHTGVTYDSAAPTAAITYSVAGPYKSGAAITITATFNESMAVSPVPQISISGANTLAATNMTRATSTRYTYAYTVSAGDGIATVALSTGTDLAGNIVTSAPTSGATFTVDNTLPAFSSVAPTVGAFINNITTASDVSYTLSEALASGSIVMTRTGGSTDGTVHTCTLTASARASGAHNNLNLSSGSGCSSTQTLVNGAIYTFAFSGTDAAGNSASPVSNTGVTYDTTVPTAAITYSVPGPYRAGALVTITATFTEAMADLPVPRISISGANTLAATDMTKSGSTVYTYAYTVVAGDGTATIALSIGTDLAGNVVTSTPTGGATFTVDNTPPTITINNPNANPAQSKTITASTSDGTLTMSNTTGATCDGTLVFGAYSSQTFLFESDNGTRVCYKAVDTAGNTAYNLSSAIAGIDTTAPAITINNPDPTPAQSKTISASPSDGTLTMRNTTGSICNGTLTFVTYVSQTFLLESDNGTKVCYRAVDTAGNAAYNLSDAIAGIDTTSPDVTIYNPTPSPAQSKTITATTSEGILTMSNTTGLTCNGALSFITYASQTFLLESDNGMKVCYQALDAAGNSSYSLSSPIAGIDTTAPAISIEGPDVGITKNGPVTYTILYADPHFNISTLGSGNISLNSTGTATGLVDVSGSGLTRTVTISNITGDGTLGISIGAGTASDTAGNLAPAAGPTTTFTVDTTLPSFSWITPPPCGQTTCYYNLSDQTIQLAVNVSDIAGISKVVFRRWDYVAKRWVEIRTIYRCAFQLYL